jgi:hypothetical protein
MNLLTWNFGNHHRTIRATTPRTPFVHEKFWPSNLYKLEEESLGERALNIFPGEKKKGKDKGRKKIGKIDFYC